MTNRRPPDSSDGPVVAGPWSTHAVGWSRIASPLRPCPEDLARLKETWIASLPNGIPRRRIDVLMLGVTPEIADFSWADEMTLCAVDSSEDMIRAVWPGDGPGRRAILGRWESMPLPDASFDLIVSDDGLAVLVEMASITAVAGQLRRLLKPGGRVVMRQFVRTGKAETEQSILAATEAGEMPNFHGLKLRLLLMHDARASGNGVRLGDVWNCFQRLFPDREALARRLGCRLETIGTIDTYRERDGRFIFRSLAEIAEIFNAFAMAEGATGNYPFAEYCPVFSLTPIE